MAVKFDEGTRESIKWVLGIIASVMIMLIKFTLDTVTRNQEEQGQKLDKVVQSVGDHSKDIEYMDKRVDQLERENREQRFKLYEEMGKRNREDFERQGNEMNELDNELKQAEQRGKLRQGIR